MVMAGGSWRDGSRYDGQQAVGRVVGRPGAGERAVSPSVNLSAGSGLHMVRRSAPLESLFDRTSQISRLPAQPACGPTIKHVDLCINGSARIAGDVTQRNRPDQGLKLWITLWKSP